MPEEKAQMLYVWRVFLVKPAPEVIKEAFDLFFSYSGGYQQVDFQWSRAITFADGEIRDMGNEPDFFFTYFSHLARRVIQHFLFAARP